jgi:general secretion pathway protein E
VQWRPLTAEEGRLLEAEGLPAPEQVPVARGCGHCRDSGYKGRLVLAEVHVVVDAVRDMMLSGGLMTDFKKVVYGDGSRRLLAQALQAVAQGRTSMEEVSRVVGLG